MRSCTSCIHKCSRRHLPNILRTMPCHFLHHCHPGSHLLPSPLRSHKSLLTAGLLHPQSCSPVAPSPQWTLNELIKSSVRPHPPSVQNPNGFHFNRVKAQVLGQSSGPPLSWASLPLWPPLLSPSHQPPWGTWDSSLPHSKTKAPLPQDLCMCSTLLTQTLLSDIQMAHSFTFAKSLLRGHHLGEANPQPSI